MKKLIIVLIATLTLSACSTITGKGKHDYFWEREQLTSNVEISGARAKNLLDRDLAECITITSNRQEIEEDTKNTKKCDANDGLDWEAMGNKKFLRQCMRDRGWIPSNCCAFKKDCSCK